MTVATKNNLQKETHQELSVQVSLTGLSFLIKDAQKNEFTFFEHTVFDHPVPIELLTEEITKSYHKHPELQQTFSDVSVIHQNALFALVPQALFDEKNSADYLKYTSKTLTTDYIDFDTIDPTEIVNVFVPYTNVNNFFFEQYGAFTFQHHNTVFIKNILMQSTMEQSLKMYVHCLNPTVDILVVKNKKVQLCNTFKCQTPEDFVYYILFVAEQLQMNPEEFELFLTGNVTKEHPFYEAAYQYIRNVTFLKPANITKFTQDIPKSIVDTHYLLTHS